MMVSSFKKVDRGLRGKVTHAGGEEGSTWTDLGEGLLMST